MNNLDPNSIENDPWGKVDEELVAKPSILESRKFWWLIGGLIFLGLVGGGTFYYLNLSASPPQVTIGFLEPEGLQVGQPFELSVTITNNSATPLLGGSLAVTLPGGLVFLDRPQNEKFADIDVGALAPNTVHSEKFRLLATGEAENNIRHVSTIYEYRGTSNDKVQFEKKGELDLTLSQAVASLSIEAPQKILSGDKFNVRFLCRNNTKQTLSGLALQAEYPTTFEFSTSTLAISKDNNEWTLPPLPPGAVEEVVIEGSIAGPSDSFYGFTGKLSQNLGGSTFLLQKISANSAIQNAALSLAIVTNKSENYIARPGDTVQYALTYRNNSEVTLSDVVLTAALTKDFFNFVKAASKGTFDSVQNIFTWNSQNTPGLAHLEPGAEGKIDLSIPLKSDYPAPNPQNKGNLLKITGRIESPTVPPNTAASKTVAVTTVETKVQGLLSLKTQGLWRDAAAKILNAGPFPPKVNTPTQFTIHWLTEATGSDFEKLQITATLSPGVRWTQVARSNLNTQPVFDAGSNRISWQIDKLAVGTKAEGIFQVEVTPAANQISKFIPLIGETKVTATDSFTGQEVSSTNPGINSNVPDDQTISGSRWVLP